MIAIFNFQLITAISNFQFPVLNAFPSGGEGRIRTFEATGATDLQSVAFDRFATSPKPSRPFHEHGATPPCGSTGVSCREPLASTKRIRGCAFLTVPGSGAGEGI